MRRPILLLVMGMTTLVVLAFAIPLAILIRHNTYQDGIRALERQANAIGLYLARQPTPAQLEAYLTEDIPQKYRAGVLLQDHQFVGRPLPGGAEIAPEPHDLDEHGGDGEGGPHHPAPPQTSSVSWHGGQLAQVLAGPNLVRVWAANDTLHEGETGWFVLLGGVALALLLIAAGAGELLTRRIVRPLAKTARTAQLLSTGDTSARAPTDGPGEVAGVGRALNRLADRIDELIAEERETVADLSHRMRTPLTALRLDAEALTDPADAERVGNHVSELERTLTAVIRAARRPEREGRMPSCDATAVVGERVAFWSALTEDQRRAATVALPHGPVFVRAAAEDLAAAVDALIENVVAHTPEGTAFAVRLAAVPGGARLAVSDDGPGLPADSPVRGRSDRGSSGLGLDIARRCAEGSGGSMRLAAAPSGGALIVLDLGAP
jgi:signal transduction histidine kinase